MKILVTGAKGFVGKNLCHTLKTICDGRNKAWPELHICKVMEYDVDTPAPLLEQYCAEADFVFHLAGVNRPKDPAEFMAGNFGFTSTLLDCLKRAGNTCPVMLSSSVQASLEGRYKNDYGRSKRAGEELFFQYGQETGAKVLVYRFPNLFGKWCRPNYNSVVATFCHNIANDLPIRVDDPATELELLYIDDLINEMLFALLNREHRKGPFCHVPATHHVTLGHIVRLLETFRGQPDTLMMCQQAADSFDKKLYATYLSYLPKEKIAYPLKMNVDSRGSFTELIKTMNCGQFSVNVSKPGVTKGQHWHHTKWELFIVVSGKGRICMRKVDSDEVLEFDVSGDHIQAVHMLPGYTHSIVNLSDTQDLITLMWANECFDPQCPDTFFETV